jgi:phospholipid/cholesterol/gamma-HCH transport system permease protein
MTKRLEQFIDFIGGNSLLSRDIGRNLFTRPFYFDLFLAQIQSIGVRSYPLVLFVTFSVGTVMALQFGIGMEHFGAKLYIPKLVSVSLARELSPLFVSLMFAARVGAGITAEIASMVVSQQVDAMRALGTSPIKKIIIPRVLACLLTLPLLVVVSNFAGFIGALLVGAFDLNVNIGYFILKIQSSVSLSDFLSGFAKSYFFSLFVSIPACYYGLNVQRGTRGVGIATTQAVVTSSILIFAGDYFLTKLIWIVESWK